jgi:hypothetical protein
MVERDTGPTSIAGGQTYTTIATMSGIIGTTYMIWAKAVVTVSQTTNVDCQLIFDANGGIPLQVDDTSTQTVEVPLGAPTATATIGLEGLLQFQVSNQPTFAVACRAGTAWSAARTKLGVIPLASGSDSVVGG